jgi:hypothetical protein
MLAVGCRRDAAAKHTSVSDLKCSTLDELEVEAQLVSDQNVTKSGVDKCLPTQPTWRFE